MSEAPKESDQRSKARPADEWFNKKFPKLSQTNWQEYTCKACGAQVAGNSLDVNIQLILEMHVDRHQIVGDILP